MVRRQRACSLVDPAASLSQSLLRVPVILKQQIEWDAQPLHCITPVRNVVALSPHHYAAFGRMSKDPIVSQEAGSARTRPRIRIRKGITDRYPIARSIGIGNVFRPCTGGKTMIFNKGNGG